MACEQVVDAMIGDARPDTLFYAASAVKGVTATVVHPDSPSVCALAVTALGH